MYPRRRQEHGGSRHVQEIRRPPHRRGAPATRNARPPRQSAHSQTALRSHPAQGRRRWPRSIAGPTRGSRRLWRFPPPRWHARGGAFAKMGWRWRSCQRSPPGGPGGGSWMAGPRLTCSLWPAPRRPKGERVLWSMRLLADRMVELGHVEAVSYETVRRTLKKTRSSRISSASG